MTQPSLCVWYWSHHVSGGAAGSMLRHSDKWCIGSVVNTRRSRLSSISFSLVIGRLVAQSNEWHEFAYILTMCLQKQMITWRLWMPLLCWGAETIRRNSTLVLRRPWTKSVMFCVPVFTVHLSQVNIGHQEFHPEATFCNRLKWLPHWFAYSVQS